MGNIIRVEDLPTEERIFLKKDMFGYRVVEPLQDPDTGKFIWKNFFNPRGFVLLGIILLILGIGYLAFQEQISNYKEVMDNPCPYCKDCQKHALNLLDDYKFSQEKVNYSKLTLG